MSGNIVNFYCKPYVAHWLQFNYGSPVKLPRRSTFRNVFLACLTKKFHDSREYDVRQYPAAVGFALHVNHLVQHGNSIQLQLHHHVNAVIEEQIKTELFMYIYAHTIKSVSVDKAIMLYQVSYGFDPTVFSADAIRRAYFRKKEEFNKIFCGTVTTT